MATISKEKHHAHELLERLDSSQLPTAVRFLEFMLLDPLSRALATAPVDDEPLSEEDREAIARSEAWFRENKGKGIPFEDVLADFGLTIDDLHSDLHKRDVQD